MLRPWKMMLAERIDPASDTPLYMQIIHALIHEIQRGRLLPGTFLPSSRELATAFRVNRKTIVLAYEDLIAQGWLASSGTRGTIVATSLPDTGVQRAQKRLRQASANVAAAEYPFKDAASLQARTWDLKLDEGSPDGRLFPADMLGRAYRSAVRRAARENRLLYGDPRGSPLLREAIATMLRTQRGVMANAENVCITRGSQMGVYLAARVLVRPGDAVIVESLTYQAAVGVLEDCGAKILPVGLDKHGVNVDEVEKMCRAHRVRAIFLTPHHQFPTTVALQPDRRLRLLNLARQFAFAVIEDDYDHEFHFESQPLLPMASYAPERVIYVGSLSKLLLPALRIGYIVAPPKVVDALAQQVMLLDSMGNTLTEDAAAELIEAGEVRRHVRKVAQVYAQRRKAFAATLSEQFAGLADFDIPDGGLAFWLRFRNLKALDRIEARALGLGIWVAPSSSFITRPDATRGLRLGFASLTEQEAREGIRRLRAAAAA
ncbi:MAG: GntR family transcriptional regulator [Gammaproteobacteria bacterium]|jgi:GntR family transcriptional regulator/MocR family aminotransferase|nr:GntR family transcriptional regulator [Gammaproteobacteria bacterium]